MDLKDMLNNTFPSFCGFMCGIALLVLLFWFPDKYKEKLQPESIRDMKWTLSVLSVLVFLHAILVPWAIRLVYRLSSDRYARPTGMKDEIEPLLALAYPIFEITWIVFFLKTLFERRFRMNPAFGPAAMICGISLFPIFFYAIQIVLLCLLVDLLYYVFGMR